MQADRIATAELARAEARLPRWMTALALTGSVAAIFLRDIRFAAGFTLGAALGILNYFWLHQAVEALMNAAQQKPSPIVTAKFLIRYPIAFAGVWVFYKTGWLPFTAILAGLFVPVAGVLLESIVQVREGFRSPEK